MSDDSNGWRQVEELVLYRLDELTKTNKEISSVIESLRTELVLFKADISEKKASKEELLKVKEDLDLLKVSYAGEMATLKLKAGIWGAVSGLIPVLLTLGIAAIAWLVKN